MFTNLSERLTQVLKNLSGRGRLTEENIKDTLRDIRMALLEADVALPVVKHCIEHIQKNAIGTAVMESLSPGQALIKLVHNELINMMGEHCNSLDLSTQPPAVILMAGLQGAGKTTTVAKLARWLQQNQKKTVLVVSTDIYRPAAIQQLETLAKNIDVEFYPSLSTQEPVAIAQAAIQAAKAKLIDVVIVDTAGRLHIDDEMMNEIKQLHNSIQPIETLFVVDSMTGQDAVNTAHAFHAALPLTGIILTKTDGDARGGAALSIRHITGKPIKFMGIGEKIDGLEPFYPDRVASRILGMGDILTLVENAERNIDRAKAEKFAKKIKKGKLFDLEDFRDQLRQISNMGGIMGIMKKLPAAGKLPKAATENINDKSLAEIEAIINSMTPKERRLPTLINGSRKRRIALGSGTDIQAINRLLKQFTHMQKMMKKLTKQGSLLKMMRGLQGKLPPGMMPPL
ncbi:MAG: ffh [Gammaproteobacteria bacterium]|jgi:signal recognition particle subunit SRP54|nr:ffh [Gammaproteobacteria bacterium]